MTYSDDPEDRVPTQPIGLTRISYDKTGDALGVARQEADVRTLARLLRWPEPVEVVVENDTSAFSRRKIRTPGGRYELRTVRPGFRRALDMLQDGQADALIAYDLDRAARDPRDLEDLIDIVEHTTPRIAVRSVTGSLRLDNDADITMARVMVAIANKASRDAGRRLRRKFDEIAASGVPARGGGPGRRGYGYSLDRATVVRKEARVIREAISRVLAGEGLRPIAVNFNLRGIPTVTGTPWSSIALDQILRAPRIAGLRSHRGVVVSRGTWPAIVSVGTWEAVLTELNGRPHGTNKVPARTYWAGRLLWCGRCGEALTGRHSHFGTPSHSYQYLCSTDRKIKGCGRISITGPHVEAYVQRQLLDWLRSPAVVATLRAVPLRGSAPEIARSVTRSADPTSAWERLRAEDKQELGRALLASRALRGWKVAPTAARRFDPGRLTLLAV